jgi:hypothetical protein
MLAMYVHMHTLFASLCMVPCPAAWSLSAQVLVFQVFEAEREQRWEEGGRGAREYS